MPNINDTVYNLSMGYIFTFDFGSEDILHLNDKAVLDMMKEFVSGYYYIPERADIVNFEEHQNELLKTYKNKMYEERFKKSVLQQRKSLMIQLPTVELNTLSYLTENSNTITTGKVALNCTVTLNEMGVGSLVLWLDFPQNEKVSSNLLLNFKQISNLHTLIDWSLGAKKELRINGDYTLRDIAQFIIICLNATFFSSVSVQKIKKNLAANKSLNDIHKDICRVTQKNNLIVSTDMVSYPIFHFDFKPNTEANVEYVSNFVKENKQLIRALATGDKNWDKKKPELVDKFLTENNFTTRESIQWFTYNEGSIKIYSNELETSLLTSKVLITFELELMLTMKHYVYKIIRNLNHFTGLMQNKFPLRTVSKFRDREMRRLDEFYNLDFIQKDTTASRVDRFKKMLNIEDVLQIAIKKIDSLNSYMNTEFQNSSALRQVALSVIFGTFTSGGLFYNIIRKAVENHVTFWGYDFGDMRFRCQLGLTLLLMSIVGSFILMYFRKVRIS